MAFGDRLADDRRVPLRQKTTQPVAEFVQRGQTGNRAHEQPLQRLVFAEVAMPLGGLSHATVVFVEQHLDQEIRAVRSASPTAVTLKEGPQIKFLIDQTVDLVRPMVGIELAVKPLPVGRFGRPGGLQKTTEERLSVVVDSSTISIRVTSCRTHGQATPGSSLVSGAVFVDLPVMGRDGRTSLVRYFTLHPATAEFIRRRFGDDAPLRLDTHRRVGMYLESQVAASPYIETDIEAGHHLFQAGEYDRAYELLGSASDWLQNRGRVREGLSLLKPFLAEAVPQAMRPELVGQLLGTLGNAYAALGQAERAIGFYEQRLAIARDRRPAGRGERPRQPGPRLRRPGPGRAGHRLLRAAIGDCARDRRPAGRGERPRQPGHRLRRPGPGRAGHRLLRAAIGDCREIGDRRGEGNALGNMGLAYADLGQAERAIGFYEQQLVIVREIGDRRGEGNALGNLGIAYAALGQAERAIGFYEQALVIDREIGDRRGEGAALGNLGSAYAALGQAERAIGFYEQRLAIAREIGDRRGEGNALGNLGLAYAALGQAERAIGLLEQALQIGQEIKDPQIIRIASRSLERWRGGSGSE